MPYYPQSQAHHISGLSPAIVQRRSLANLPIIMRQAISLSYYGLPSIEGLLTGIKSQLSSTVLYPASTIGLLRRPWAILRWAHS